MMTVNTFSWMSAPSNASDTAMRKWIQGIHDALAAAGLVQSSDTGQISIGSVSSGSAVSETPVGYEVWRFDDDWQATCPVFFKIEYGHGYAPGGTGRPALWLTVGTGTNGSGTVTGTLIARRLLGSPSFNAASSSTEYASYASGDGSSAHVILWPAWSTSHTLGGFSIERSCDVTGEYTGAAIAVSTYYVETRSTVVVGCHGSAGASQYAEWQALPIRLPSNVNGASTAATALLLQSATLSEDGTTAPVFPLPFAAPGVAPWVSNTLVAVTPGDAGATSVIQVATINGQERTFRAFPYVPANTNSAGGLVAGNTAAFPAIGWSL